jgi:Fe-S-cluster-containing dehydrogenase component
VPAHEAASENGVEARPGSKAGGPDKQQLPRFESKPEPAQRAPIAISRRGFITGAVVGSLGLAGTARAGSGVHLFEGHPGRKGLLHDTTLCVGCRSCEFACNEVNKLPVPKAPVNDKTVFSARRGINDKLFTVVNKYAEGDGRQQPVYRKHQCMHCNEPCCASVCFVKAFVKTPEGPVLYDPDLCVGCRYCVFACPYYALAYEYGEPLAPKVVRCTMCYPRIKEGKTPACADACPTGAIVYGKREDLVRMARERIRKFPGRYIAHIFGEHEYGGTSWLTLSGTAFSKLDLPESIVHEPLPNLTTSFLSLAPLVTALIPGLLAGFYAFTKRKDHLHEEALRAEQARFARERAGEIEKALSAARQQAARDIERAVERGRRAGRLEAMREASEAAKPSEPPQAGRAPAGSADCSTGKGGAP